MSDTLLPMRSVVLKWFSCSKPEVAPAFLNETLHLRHGGLTLGVLGQTHAC